MSVFAEPVHGLKFYVNFFCDPDLMSFDECVRCILVYYGRLKSSSVRLGPIL